MESPIVLCRHVSKRFRLGATHDSFRDLISSALRRIRGLHRADHGFAGTATRPSDRPFWALQDVSFEAGKGQALGIIGPNGAGKSTMLKLLAGILRPDAGTLSVRGRIAALIEVGAGFHGDLTGRENIFLNGAILGMSRGEIRRKLEAIVAFSGIERFLDTPVKRYSSGMYARLGFAIASHVDPDVLLVDEVLSVGDAVFRLKCLDRMKDLLRSGTTLVFVTHNLDQMQAVCDQTLVLDGGRAVFLGLPHDAVDRYLASMSTRCGPRPTDLPGRSESGPPDVELLDFVLRFPDLSSGGPIRSGDPIRLTARLRLNRPIPRLVLEMNLRNATHDHLVSLNSGRAGYPYDLPAGTHDLTVMVRSFPLGGGHYWWNVRVWDLDRGTTELDTPYRFPLRVTDGAQQTGLVWLHHQWVTGTGSDSEPRTIGAIHAASLPNVLPHNDRADGPSSVLRHDLDPEDAIDAPLPLR